MVEGAAFLCLCHDDVELAARRGPPDGGGGLPLQRGHRHARSSSGPTTRRAAPRRAQRGPLRGHDRARRARRGRPGPAGHRARRLRRARAASRSCAPTSSRRSAASTRSIVAIGEDLDLCWRAQVAGSRVVVAHAAVVAHHELLANGARHAHRDRSAGHGGRDAAGAHAAPPALDDAHLLRLAVPASRPSRCSWSSRRARSSSPLVGRDRERIGAIVGSWRWCLGRLGTLRARHRALAKARVLDDHDVRRLQVAGASRLQTFGSRLVHEGVDVARGALVPATIAAAHEADEPLDHTVGFGAAFSDDASFDELDDLGHRDAPPARAASSRRCPTQVAVVGRCRARASLIGGAQPRRVAPPARRAARAARLVVRRPGGTSSRRGRPTGVGTGAPGAPGFGVLGVRRDVRLRPHGRPARAPRSCSRSRSARSACGGC